MIPIQRFSPLTFKQEGAFKKEVDRDNNLTFADLWAVCVFVPARSNRDARVHLSASGVYMFCGVFAHMCVYVLVSLCVCVYVCVRDQKLEDVQYQHSRRPEQPLMQTGGEIYLNFSNMMEHIMFYSWGHRSPSFNLITVLLFLISAHLSIRE